jgi:hypothetical protein
MKFLTELNNKIDISDTRKKMQLYQELAEIPGVTREIQYFMLDILENFPFSTFFGF